MNFDAVCTNCKSDLTMKYSVEREYTNLSGGFNVYSEGHYDKHGFFESDSFNGFGEERFDLKDDSDRCVNCRGNL